MRTKILVAAGGLLALVSLFLPPRLGAVTAAAAVAIVWVAALLFCGAFQPYDPWAPRELRRRIDRMKKRFAQEEDDRGET